MVSNAIWLFIGLLVLPIGFGLYHKFFWFKKKEIFVFYGLSLIQLVALVFYIAAIILYFDFNNQQINLDVKANVMLLISSLCFHFGLGTLVAFVWQTFKVHNNNFKRYLGILTTNLILLIIYWGFMSAILLETQAYQPNDAIGILAFLFIIPLFGLSLMYAYNINQLLFINIWSWTTVLKIKQFWYCKQAGLSSWILKMRKKALKRV